MQQERKKELPSDEQNAEVERQTETKTALDRNLMADLLDEIIQVVSEGTRGQRRVPTTDRKNCSTWDERMAILEDEANATLRLLRTKNSRAAARARQASKRRGLSQSTHG